jgi:hypothetical protein
MLAHEWLELEALCERIADLRERLAAARKTGNAGLAEGLGAEMDQATRQRQFLVRYISTRLGAAGTDPPPASSSTALTRGRGPTRPMQQPVGRPTIAQ